MTQTDYLLILASIVIGLGLTELLKGLAETLRARASVYWVQGLVGLNALFFLLQFWWSMWGWRRVHTWTPVGLLILIVGVTALYLLSYLVFPEEVAHTGDSRSYYYEHSRWMWIMVATYMLTGLLASRVILDLPWRLDPGAAQQLVGVGIASALAGSKRRWIHAVLVSAVTVVNLFVFFG